MRQISGTVAVLFALGVASSSLSALAQDGAGAQGSESNAEAAPDAEAEPDAEADARATTEDGDSDGISDPTEIDRGLADGDPSSPVEAPGETYLFVGLRYREIIIPEFMITLFADGGTTAAVESFGPEFGLRKDNFEFNFGAWYADYSLDPTPFKGKSDPESEWEVVESKISMLYLTADFLWTSPITPEFGINYGMGAGFGVVWGDLIRNEAYPDPNGSGYLPCAGPGNPPGNYCGPASDEEVYDYNEPNWANGGSKPVIFPWFALQTGARYKPHRNFAARLDLGFGLSGFFLGLGADYGI